MTAKYSFVIPIYNEQENIPMLYSRLTDVMDGLDGRSEIIFVDDGSKDNSIIYIRELGEKDNRVCYISLARNFGHQIALTAGLNYVTGQAVIVLDADLQDPPELVPEMIEKWKQGNQVIFAQRTYRHKEGVIKRFTAFAFYRILKLFSEVEIPTDTGDFCLLDKKIVDTLNSMPERNRYIRGLRSWIGFNQIAIHYERPPRYAGEVKYTYKKLFGLALNGLVSFSKLPLRISTYLGLIAAGGSIIMAFLVLYWRISQPNSQFKGYAIVLMAVFFLGAVQLISIGILGEYVGKMYEEVKRRPLYTLKELGRLPQKKADQLQT
ncbi:MAG: glycosyl transferase family 2 [Segetibacter sp.]|nr:glycosyl transferase family 2 [Segetibacter sp.]